MKRRSGTLHGLHRALDGDMIILVIGSTLPLRRLKCCRIDILRVRFNEGLSLAREDGAYSRKMS
jgi:hypothetical protein